MGRPARRGRDSLSEDAVGAAARFEREHLRTEGGGLMDFEFTGQIWYWRGPAPWYFVTVPPLQADELKALSAVVTYGWGMIPAKVRIGKTEWATALWPKDGSYIVPIKASIRQAESLHEGDTVTVRLVVG